MDNKQVDALKRHVSAIQAACDRLLLDQKGLSEKKSECDAHIAAINSKNVSQEIRRKISVIYENAAAATESLVKAERSVSGSGNRLSAALKKPRETDDGGAQFVEQARALYRIMQNNVNAIEKRGFCDTSDEQMNAVAAAYCGIKHIYNNTETLLDKFVCEEKRKKSEKEKVRDEYARVAEAISLKNRTSLDAVRREEYMLNETAAEINFAARSCSFSSDDNMESSFDRNAVWHLGAHPYCGITEKSIQIPVERRNIRIPEISSPYDIELGSDNGNILIGYGGTVMGAELYKTLECAVLRFLMCYPAHFKNIAIMCGESYEGKEHVDLMSVVKSCCTSKEFWFDKNSTTGVTSEEHARDLLEKINNVIDENRSTCGAYDNILHFNEQNSDNAKPLTLFIMIDVDLSRQDTSKKIKQILRNGAKSGVYVMCIANDRNVNAGNGYAGYGEFFAHKFEAQKDGKLKRGGTEVNCTLGTERVSIGEYCNIVKKGLASYKVVLDFDSFQNGIKPYDTSAPDRIVIPIGKSGSAPAFLELNYNSQLFGAVIAGTAGTGKTGLLHSIISGAAYRYSPSQLEIWLMDFKHGTSFNPYRKLKHVKAMILENKISSLDNVLAYLIDEVNRRNGIFKANNVDSIAKYNAKATEKMPFILAVIDEYNAVDKSRSCIEKMTELARRCRSSGMSLILSAQNRDGNFDDVIAQIKHRFDFGHDGGRLLDADIDRFKSDLSVKGACVYEGNSDAKAIRVAFVSNVDRTVEKINAQYPDFGQADPVVLGEPEIEYRSWKSARNSVIDRQSALVELGKRELSDRPVKYKIDDKNPFLVLFGDSGRVKNIEYGIARDFAESGGGETNVYYLNKEKAGGDPITAYAEIAPHGVRFASTPSEVCELLDRLAEIMTSRLEKNDNNTDVGTPIEIIVHNCDLLGGAIKRFAEKRGAGSSDLTDMDVGDLQARLNVKTIVKSDRDIDLYGYYKKIFGNLIENGKTCRMYMTVHCNDGELWNDCKTFLTNNGMTNALVDKDAIIVPTVPQTKEEISYNSIHTCLRALGLHDECNMYGDSGGKNASDMAEFNRCILIDERKIAAEYLPIEYTCEDNE